MVIPAAFETTWPHLCRPVLAKLNPFAEAQSFAEAQFGVTDVKTTVTQITAPSRSSSDSGFSWMIGGGVDYKITSNWAGRFKIDLLRSHFNDSAQSRLRLALGVAYTFGQR